MRARMPFRVVVAKLAAELNIDRAVERTVVATGAITAGSERAIAATRDMVPAAAPVAENIRPNCRIDVDTVRAVADSILPATKLFTNEAMGAVVAERTVAAVRDRLPVADTSEASALPVVR